MEITSKKNQFSIIERTFLLSVVNLTSGVLLRLQPYVLQARSLNWYSWLCSSAMMTLLLLSASILCTSTQIWESTSLRSSSKYWGIFQPYPASQVNFALTVPLTM